MLTSPFPSHEDRRAADKVFGSAATAPRRARAFVRCQLGRWELPQLVDTAELLASELVTNAVQATNSVSSVPIASSMFPVTLRMVALRLSLSSGPRSLFIEVWDGSEREPVPAESGEWDEGGRGLTLVGSLATKWGHYTAPDRGKIVWCELAVPLPRTPDSVTKPPPSFGAQGLSALESPDFLDSPEFVGSLEPLESLGPFGAEAGEPHASLPRRMRRNPRGRRAEGPDAATLLRVLEGLRKLDLSDSTRRSDSTQQGDGD
ncbi:ATP-binding protein [Planotetraspora sp. A-T 1434]|uniref:ATP-binding protein n=1 Tax=Planotetraspora sp. A-T 1434 TaxID=2979219 RepID=UPI0021C1AA16|nr:ATP-binding protein [Planotetraspora sp. A-T 1434]MCT9933070.1 ATP-binding protein [Planotetraspora sp. A-T 1434]